MNYRISFIIMLVGALSLICAPNAKSSLNPATIERDDSLFTPDKLDIIIQAIERHALAQGDFEKARTLIHARALAEYLPQGATYTQPLEDCGCQWHNVCSGTQAIVFSDCTGALDCYDCCIGEREEWFDICEYRLHYCMQGGDLCACLQEHDCCLKCVYEKWLECKLSCNTPAWIDGGNPNQ